MLKLNNTWNKASSIVWWSTSIWKLLETPIITDVGLHKLKFMRQWPNNVNRYKFLKTQFIFVFPTFCQISINQIIVSVVRTKSTMNFYFWRAVSIFASILRFFKHQSTADHQSQNDMCLKTEDKNRKAQDLETQSFDGIPQRNMDILIMTNIRNISSTILPSPLSLSNTTSIPNRSIQIHSLFRKHITLFPLILPQ